MRHFISNRAKNHGTSVTPPLLITITQDCFTVKNNFSRLYHSLGLWAATTQVWGL